MTAQNTLELARRGDPAAIAIILTYHLSQRYNATASAIRLGDYLSILIDANFVADQAMFVNLVLSILRDLRIEDIAVIEMSVRQMGDREVQWSQTIELADSSTPNPMMTESINTESINTESISTESISTEQIEPTPAVERGETATSPAPDSSAPDTEWEATLKTLVQRPEMVALVAFALILVLWDSYMEWVDTVDLTQPLSGVKLARRLGISAKTLNRFKERANFSQWSQELDPDGIAWSYENKVFVPRLNS